jgi:hypothetical protein
VVTSYSRGNDKSRSDDGAQNARRRDGKRELSKGERQSRCSASGEQRSHNPSAAMKSRQTGAKCDEKRKRINCERKNQPAEQADPDGVESASMVVAPFKGVTVAPSTTTAAQQDYASKELKIRG